MPLPAGVETVTVSSGEPLVLPDGTLIRGRLRFTAPDLVTIDSDDVVLGGTIDVPLEDGEFTVTLAATDATGMNPTGWTYKVSAVLLNAPSWIRHISLPKATPTVILADILVPDPFTPEFEDAFLPLAGGTMTGPLILTSGGIDVDAQQAIGSTVSTGVISGGELSANGLDPAAVDIGATVGYVVDVVTAPTAPVVTRVTTADQTVPLDAASLLRSVTWWLMDSSANVIQQGTTPTPEQRRTHLVLGVTTFFGGAVVVTQTLPVILAQPANQFADLMGELGPFSSSGNSITANGANLMINQSSGKMFARAFSHFVSGALTNSPHIVDTQAQAPSQFRYITATGTVFGPLVNTVDVANFDNAGVITPIGGGANTASVHRLWLFGTGEASTQLAFQYGQTTHASLTAAAAAIGQDGHVVNPLIVGNGALIAHVVAIRSATNLSDPAQAVIRAAGKFAVP
jgi:hypothetical protein